MDMKASLMLLLLLSSIPQQDKKTEKEREGKHVNIINIHFSAIIIQQQQHMKKNTRKRDLSLCWLAERRMCDDI